MCTHIIFIYFHILKAVLGQSFEIIPENDNYRSLFQLYSYNYGYWFKFLPLTKFKDQQGFGNSNSNFYKESKGQLIGFELSADSNLTQWHFQTDKFESIVNIVQTDGMKQFIFQQDLINYEGRWNFFGIQVISYNQYQIIFFSNQIKIIRIDAQIQRSFYQEYYIGGYGTYYNQGSQMYFQRFKGKLTNFVELFQLVTESNFEETVLSDRQSYLNTLYLMKNVYFDILNFDGQSVVKFKYQSYREGIRYAFNMWVKSSIEQYSQPLNYSIFRASLNDKLTDTYLGDKQLFIQYQLGLVPSDNIVFAMTYSFEIPVLSLQMKNYKDWIKISDIDLIKGLKQWHFIQFEYGRTSRPDAFPPVYNSLFTLILPNSNKQFNQDWNRDNHHFTGVPIYFYLGGSLSQHENKFIGSISQFTFISYNTQDLLASIECHFTCLTCSGPTSSDCLTCSEEAYRVFQQNQCVCQLGYVNSLSDSCELASLKYQMIQILETEYKCPEGYDQCGDLIVCSFGYFKRKGICQLCPQQHSEQIYDNNIYCVDCVINPNQLWFGDCRSNMLQLDSNIFSLLESDIIYYEDERINNTFQLIPRYQYSLRCEKGYGYGSYNRDCTKCQNCTKCEYQSGTEICLECPRSYYLNGINCIKCGIDCVKCDQNGCLQCQQGSFLTIDKINCNQCSIQNCIYCYQYYQNQTSNHLTISLDLKFNQLNLTLEGIVTGCARCHDGFAIQGTTCIEYSLGSCLTGVIENDQFACLIYYDQETGLQFNNCNLMENCYSCFIKYPTNPWCIQCVDGYYAQFEDGSCITCPDICASCLRLNSVYKDSWKINIRAFYYHKFQSHLFEDYAIDTEHYEYNIVCTSCKDDQILYENACIPGCGQKCEDCDIKDGKAVCKKCKDNQYGPVMSLDLNQQCQECPVKCYACIHRDISDIKYMNENFDTNLITGSENRCFLPEKGYFLDNEFQLPIKCENSQKCYKQLILSLDVYCNQKFIKDNSNCGLNDIQQCLEDIFDQMMIDYLKKQVIKELEIILNIQDQFCQLKFQTINQFVDKRIWSLKKTTLKLQSQMQSELEILSTTTFSNFTNYLIHNLILKQFNESQIIIIGQQQNISFEQVTIITIQIEQYLSLFKFENVWFLFLKDIIIKDYQQEGSYLFQINNQVLMNITIRITGLSVNSTHLTSNVNNGYVSRFFSINSEQDGQINFILTNIRILNSIFENGFQFIVSNNQQFKSIINNLIMENNTFKDCQFIKFENVYEQPQFSITAYNNYLINSILFQIPILNLQNSIFQQNKLSESSILIKSIGSFDDGQIGWFNFQQLLIQQNEYYYGCQFIIINQQDQQNLSVYFENYSSINNQEMNILKIILKYEQSLIFVNSNYVFLNTFIIERLNGTIELSIIQTQQIQIKNLTIHNNKIHKIIAKSLSCLQESQNLVVYIFDTKQILIDTFIINQLSSIDFSIIIIQSQSILKKVQNETIILKNGFIINNSLVVSQLNKQISVIQINSQQEQQIDIVNLKFVKNILNSYVQDLQMLSAATTLIYSSKGQVQFQNCNFQQNYVINSTNSQLSIQCNLIQIRNTIFLNNNIFDLEVLKNFLILNYNGKISIEQIKLKDYPILSNGGSGYLIASEIIIQNINIQGSFGSNGGSFYIQTLELSNIKISDSVIQYSFTNPDNTNSQGGTFYIDGSKSNLQLIIENVETQYSQSRKSGGCIYLKTLQFTSQITNLRCTNCYSINGGFIMMDSTNDYPPYISLTKITLQNPDFKWFLENIIEMTIDEQIMFGKNSYLLYLPNSIVQLYQILITDGNISGILFFQGKKGLIIKGMAIQQYRVFLTPLITISHSQITQNLIYITDIEIKNINSGQTNQYVCNNQIIQFVETNDCSRNEFKEPEIFSYYNDLYKANNYNCNYKNIYQTSQKILTVIEIYNFTTNKINIENININNVSYQAEYGLLSLRDFSQFANQVKITNLQILNSQCGKGCLLISSSTQNFISGNNRLLINLDDLVKSQNSSVILQNSKFLNNQATYGSGIYVINISTLIINTQFINNTAQKLGGAIYFNGNINNLFLLNNQIINNSAENQSGSGVYLNHLPMSKLEGLQNMLIDNQQDFNEIPQKLQILFNNIMLNKFIVITNQFYDNKNDSQTFIEEVYFRPYKLLGQKILTDVITLPSGQSIKDYQYFDQSNQQYIPYNLSLRFIPINRFKQQLYDQHLDLQVSARTKNSNFSNKYFNKDFFVYDNTTQSFNLDDLIIYYSPYEQNNLEVKVESTDIKIPIYSSIPPYNIESYQNYELRFMIKTFSCQLGQFYDINMQCCQQCTGNTYSVQLNSRICVFKDDNFINEVNSAMVELKLGFWRAYVFSPKIDSCYHLQENCIGGWGTGNQLCSQGHIGALCEQCDLYNIRGNGSYSVSSLYQCGSCTQVTGNIMSVILISVWTLISIVMSVQSTIEYIDDHIRKGKFVKLGLTLADQKSINHQLIFFLANPAIIIKVLSNYLQIIATITTFQLQVPPGVASVFNSVGNPINQMAYSLDCFLIDLTRVNIIYFRIIWSLVIAFSYILIYLIGYFILVFTKKTIFNISAVTTCFIYVFVFLQPNLISSLIQLVSYRYISGQSWIAGNVSYRYDTKTHTIWLISFVIPLLLVIGLIIPVILWFGIFKNRKSLNDTKVKSIWGYLYNEYKLSSFYWETIKISQKEFIIIVLAYYEDYIPIKAALVFICLFFYSQFTNIKKPYNQGMFNTLDSQQTTICAVSIILATTIYTAQQYNLQEIIWPFYMIISLLNFFFILKLLGILIYAYGQAFETQLDQIRDAITFKYPDLMNQNPILKRIFQNQDNRKKRINLRFMQIKQYLLPKAQLVIQFKKQNNIIVQPKPQKPSYIRQTQLNDNINSPQTQEIRLNME